ncbi:SMI1/KNR4 family protein [Nonomuraea polychroma]|uniref:SMI1/KNR4 family protein n=1 Tax=Nonomuraea polychroma TaxID=46176 RepID=UPI003D901640
MTSLADLVALIGPAGKPATVVDWAAVEAEVGLTFPDDYKAWADSYADLQLNDFLYLNHPLPDGDERAAVIDRLDDLRPIIEQWGSIDLLDDAGVVREAPPFPLYPEPGGLYPWGSTDNGDYLLWLTGPDPGTWTVVITDGMVWWHFPGSLLDFLVGILTHKVRCPVFPDDFPDGCDIEEFTPEDHARIRAEHGL